MKNISEDVVNKATLLFLDHLSLVMEKKGKRPFVGLHESLGVITEEYFEAVNAVQKNSAGRFVDECLDIMVSAFWAVASLYSIGSPEPSKEGKEKYEMTLRVPFTAKDPYKAAEMLEKHLRENGNVGEVIRFLKIRRCNA